MLLDFDQTDSALKHFLLFLNLTSLSSDLEHSSDPQVIILQNLPQ